VKILEQGASESELLAAAHEWVKLLAAGLYQAAYDYLYDPGRDWSPEQIEAVVSNGGHHQPDGTTHRISSPELAISDRPPLHGMVYYEGADHLPTMGFIWFDLPLDGQWSDAVVILLVVRHDSTLVLMLNHIMNTGPRNNDRGYTAIPTRSPSGPKYLMVPK
jgi:hypothetical protein